MEQLKNNVEVLKINTVFDDITTFLEEDISNENSRKAYKKDIEDFFWITRKRKLHELKEEDLTYSYNDVLKYRRDIKKKYTKSIDGEDVVNHNTVNRKISTLASLYKYLLKNNYDVNANAFNLKTLNGKKTLRKTGFMTIEEAEQVIEKAKELPNGEEKSLCLELLYKTSIRVNDICDLKWKNIKKHADQDLYVINIIGKSDKEDTKAITNEFYNRLAQLKDEKTMQKDNVFSFLKLTAQRAFNEVVDLLEMNRSERKLSIHSMKKVLINNELKKGNVLGAARQGNHGLEVMHRHYFEMSEDYTNSPGIVIEREDRGLDWENFSREELIAALKETGYETQLSVYGKLQK